LHFQTLPSYAALYRQQVNSKEAARFFAAMPEPLHVSPLLLYEFRQSVRFQVFLHSNDQQKGYGKSEAEAALAMARKNIASGALVIVPADWVDVHAIAERISANIPTKQDSGLLMFSTLRRRCTWARGNS